MKKSVTVNGEKIKVDFTNHHYVRTLNTEDRKENYHHFEINGNLYPVSSISKRGRTGKFSTSYYYNGINFNDSEKKVIEFILNNQNK